MQGPVASGRYRISSLMRGQNASQYLTAVMSEIPKVRTNTFGLRSPALKNEV
jgi:hypothetical protein